LSKGAGGGLLHWGVGGLEPLTVGLQDRTASLLAVAAHAVPNACSHSPARMRPHTPTHTPTHTACTGLQVQARRFHTHVRGQADRGAQKERMSVRARICAGCLAPKPTFHHFEAPARSPSFPDLTGGLRHERVAVAFSSLVFSFLAQLEAQQTCKT